MHNKLVHFSPPVDCFVPQIAFSFSPLLFRMLFVSVTCLVSMPAFVKHLPRVHRCPLNGSSRIVNLVYFLTYTVFAVMMSNVSCLEISKNSV